MSLLRNLATSLINAQDERLITTLPKAKELRPFVERAITLRAAAACSLRLPGLLLLLRAFVSRRLCCAFLIAHSLFGSRRI